MNAPEFIGKWRKVDLTERSAAQQHFLDLCELVKHPKPAEADPTGDTFTFERGAAKHGGGDGWADVWKKGFFGWEYKGKHKDLDAAYDQLLQYREALENPPLLVVCDMDRIVVHTNFTATPVQVHDIPLEQLAAPRHIEIIRAVFHDPDKLRPGAPSEAITADAASRLAAIAQTMRTRGLPAVNVAHMLDRVIFCLFAEDVALLPKDLFTRIVEKSKDDPARFAKLLGQLFHAMAHGGDFGADTIRHFNGNLFDDVTVLELTEEEIESIHRAAGLDWSAIDPSIFGTLFERGLDPDKRSQLGAHYTSRQDIETLVEPVVMQPLRREWDELRATLERLLATGRKRPPKRGTGERGTGFQPVDDRGTGVSPVIQSGSDHGRDGRATKLTPAQRRKARREADRMLKSFQHRLATAKVLDPACGSGNFLYVTLQKLMDLESEVIRFAMQRLDGGLLPRVRPEQLYGIEINPYAFELAQMAVWIGYLQWTRQHGFAWHGDPVLTRMDNFHCQDAILDLTDPDHPKEPDWPKVDFIVGNPPFLGSKMMRDRMGDDYVDRLIAFWRGRVRAEADLCCYWFEKARAHIERSKCQRAGLLATQGIRGGASREVLKRIKETGNIFFAQSDRPWVLDGANVHVSMVGFDRAQDAHRVLDGSKVNDINANLTSYADVTSARRIGCNRGLAFMGVTKGGPFELSDEEALGLLGLPNPNGRPNSDVILPWSIGKAITSRMAPMWILDFGVDESMEKMSRYEKPFDLASERIKPARQKSRSTVGSWWQHERARPEMYNALGESERFLATCMVAKHRMFVWLARPCAPANVVIVFARSDDYFFGVLHSRLHEVWALRLGTRLETRPRYTPTTCFETFPLPWPPGDEPGGTGVSPVDDRGTGVSPVIQSGSDHGRDGRATHGGATHGRATDGATAARIPSDGVTHIRQGAYLPHWTLKGATYFVTFRLGDSLPASMLEAWIAEKAALERRSADPVHPLTEEDRSRLVRLMSEKVEAYLDAGHGSCCLRDDAAAAIAQNTLLHFDGERYDLLAWSVMPNHVHVVVQPKAGHDLPGILHSWKSFTSHKINALLTRRGELWQPEYYDHLVRDEGDLARCVEYTYSNPDRAGLRHWRWRGVCSGAAADGTSECGATDRGTGVSPVIQSGSDHGRDGRATQGRAIVEAIAVAAKELDDLRNNWLNPPEWTREEVLEFPGSADGPWARYVHDPDDRGVGTVRYPRLVAKDADCAAKLKKRTLTNLYNERPTWLDLAHRALDEAVFAAYGWPPDLSDEAILEKLLELNLARNAAEGVT